MQNVLIIILQIHLTKHVFVCWYLTSVPAEFSDNKTVMELPCDTLFGDTVCVYPEFLLQHFAEITDVVTTE